MNGISNTTKNNNVTCYKAMKATSAGVWIGDNPLHFSFPLLICQITIIFILSRIIHFFLRRLSQPIAISQIIAGVMLGPSVLGRHRKLKAILFNKVSWQHLNAVGLFSFTLFLFMIGVKTDITMIPKAGKKAVAIAIFTTFLPASIVLLVAYLQGSDLPTSFSNGHIITELVFKWSRTSYAVLSCALAELELLTSKLGRLAMSASLIIDVANLFFTAANGSYSLYHNLNMGFSAFISFVCFLGFLVFIIFLARPFILWVIRQTTPEGALLDEACFIMVIFLALGCALISETIGYHATMGAFILGLVLPGGVPLGVTVAEKMERLVTGVLLPVFLAMAGLRMDLAKLTDSNQWEMLEAYIIMLTLAKLIGAMLPCLYFKMPLLDALSVGLMMNSRGIYEVDSTLRWLDDKDVDNQLYTTFVLSIIIIGGGTAPLVKYLYHPEDRFVAYKRRTIQHSKHGDDFRVLACIHNQDNVAPIITLLEASHPTVDSPICLYLLHLVELVGRVDAILVPYKRHRSSTSTSTDTDRIVNAFRFFEQQHPSSVSFIPYLCLSPYATMHDDICSLALDKKVTLVILPFHRNVNIDGTLTTPNPALRAINCNALRYAPCSIAILIDHGLTAAPALAGGGLPLQRILVYFLGGADDREALAYATRMAEDPAIGLTVVRIRPPKEWRCGGGKNELLDEEMMDEFQRERLERERVVYREEVAKDGSDTVRLIQETSVGFSLAVVGRRQGMESQLTEGMSMWSEYPELGVIGDLLASKNFGGSVSTLVVQQQTRVSSTQVESPRAGKRLPPANQN